jgi:hypothetical protein
MSTTPADMKERLDVLEAERTSARQAGLGGNRLYMAGLEAEIAAVRAAYAGSAVIEIARLRAWLDGPLNG